MCLGYSSYGEEIPRYQANLEKSAVLGICNPSERMHIKWKQTLNKKKERDNKLKRRHETKNLGRIIAASVQACDRYFVIKFLFLF